MTLLISLRAISFLFQMLLLDGSSSNVNMCGARVCGVCVVHVCGACVVHVCVVRVCVWCMCCVNMSDGGGVVLVVKM